MLCVSTKQTAHRARKAVQMLTLNQVDSLHEIALFAEHTAASIVGSLDTHASDLSRQRAVENISELADAAQRAEMLEISPLQIRKVAVDAVRRIAVRWARESMMSVPPAHWREARRQIVHAVSVDHN